MPFSTAENFKSFSLSLSAVAAAEIFPGILKNFLR
jgi:hypothetical protein